MTKTELLGRTQGVAVAFVYSIYLRQFSENEQVGGVTIEAMMLEKMKTTGFLIQTSGQPEERIFPDQLRAMYADPANLQAAKKNSSFMLALSLLRFAFEATVHYAEPRNAMDLLKNEPWFYYSRVVRNVTSHGTHSRLGRWDRELKGLGVTSVTWRHRTIVQADVGKAILFNEFDAWRLYLDIVETIQKVLP